MAKERALKAVEGGQKPAGGKPRVASVTVEDGAAKPGAHGQNQTRVTLGLTPTRPALRVSSGMETSVRSSLVGRVERWLRHSLDQMSDDEVLRAVEAQSPAETIAEILAATPETRAAAENDWAELLLRGAESKRQIAELVGGLLTSSQAAEVLHISVPGVKQRMDRRKLLAVPLPGGQWGFPSLQFEQGGSVRAGVAEVAKAASHVDPWALLSILVDDVDDGSGGTLLQRLDEPAVLADVLHRLATYGEHVAG